MKSTYYTDRLIIKVLQMNDAAFIKQLTNTSDWVTFIGERHIHTLETAREYIRKIAENPLAVYWTVHNKQTMVRIGIVTFLKRDYLPHWDIGFAFLPDYQRSGFAYEAASVILQDLLASDLHKSISATTLDSNVRSIRLLQKLGMICTGKLDNNLLFSTTTSII